MPTQAASAYGILLKMGANTIPELVNLTDVGGQFGVADVSAHDGAGWVSRIPTLLDGGTIRAVCNFIPNNTQHLALRTAMLTRTSTAFTVTFPTVGSPIWSFNAFVTSYRIPGAPVNGALQINIDLTVDGVITMA